MNSMYKCDRTFTVYTYILCYIYISNRVYYWYPTHTKRLAILCIINSSGSVKYVSVSRVNVRIYRPI